MPFVADELPKRRGGRASKYDSLYDKVLDGQIWGLIEGEDYESAVATMRTNLSKAAKARGLKAHTRVTEDVLYVQASSAE